MLFNIILTAAAMLPLAAAGVYDRPLAFVYATKGGKGLPQYSDQTILDHFRQVKGGVTSLPAFLLNVEDPMQKYGAMITGLQKMNITMIPAVGGPPSNEILTSDFNKGVAKGYRAFTDYIRLETGLGYIQLHGAQSVQDMIDYCTKTLGFKHVMLNPWPENKGAVVRFPNPEVESTFDNVLSGGGQDWYPGNQNKIKAVRSYRPSAAVLINYESPGQQVELGNLEKKRKGASIQAMQITVNKINGQFNSEDLKWCPPLGRSYDAFGLGTWDWIAGQLSKQ